MIYNTNTSPLLLVKVNKVSQVLMEMTSQFIFTFQRSMTLKQVNLKFSHHRFGQESNLKIYNHKIIASRTKPPKEVKAEQLLM